MKKPIVALVIVAAAAGSVWRCAPPRAAAVRFAPEPLDFARLEHEYPLSRDERRSLTPAGLADYSQEQVDQIYGRLTAGPIPDGAYDGDLFFPRGAGGETRLGEILGGRLKARIASLGVRNAEALGRLLWKGKVFYRTERLLRNRIEDLAVLAPLAGGTTAGIQKQSVKGRDTFLLFPARVYCGQSLLDGRRESIVIDYAFADELPGYREHPDALAGRNGLSIRDEVRMVRPGFYLGRAYIEPHLRRELHAARRGCRVVRRAGVPDGPHARGLLDRHAAVVGSDFSRTFTTGAARTAGTPRSPDGGRTPSRRACRRGASGRSRTVTPARSAGSPPGPRTGHARGEDWM